jgi:hypothetical protein
MSLNEQMKYLYDLTYLQEKNNQYLIDNFNLLRANELNYISEAEMNQKKLEIETEYNRLNKEQKLSNNQKEDKTLQTSNLYTNKVSNIPKDRREMTAAEYENKLRVNAPLINELRGKINSPNLGLKNSNNYKSLMPKENEWKIVTDKKGNVKSPSKRGYHLTAQGRREKAERELMTFNDPKYNQVSNVPTLNRYSTLK